MVTTLYEWNTSILERDEKQSISHWSPAFSTSKFVFVNVVPLHKLMYSDIVLLHYPLTRVYSIKRNGKQESEVVQIVDTSWTYFLF